MEADEHFFSRLKQGYRMEKPKYSPNKVYEIMKNCWENDPASRPSFTSLAEDLGAQLESSVRHYYIELNDANKSSNNAKETPDYLNVMRSNDCADIDNQVSPMLPRPVYENLAPGPTVEYRF